MLPSAPDAVCDGIVLAATIAGDRDASAARPGLAPALGDAACARLADGALSGPGREPALRAIAASLRPGLDARDGDGLPARARAILATDVPREVGARWIGEAGAPRAGFRAPAALRAQLRRLATARAEGDAGADRGAGRRVLCIAMAGDPALRERALAALDASESAAVLALESLMRGDAGIGGEEPLAAALARAALACARPGAGLTRALGEMARGARQAGSGEGRSEWERAGREIALLEGHACRG